MKKIAVIGGGASGMMAAISAAGNGADVTVFEKNERVGKKLLSTGNGKCNFSNRKWSIDCYYGEDKSGLEDIFRQFGTEDTEAFFRKAGMLIKDKSGYLYPMSEQASTVLDVLRLELAERKVEIQTSSAVKNIRHDKKNGTFSVLTEAGTEYFDSVIIACGGCAAPKTGSDGSGFVMAEKLGHRIIPTVPALVQLRCSEGFKMAAGVRCDASLRLEADGKTEGNERGELQFTDYGISGIPVFQFSRTAAYLLKKGRKPYVYIDFFPDYSKEEFHAVCESRIECLKNRTLEDFLLGMANKKINLMLIKQAGLKPSEEVRRIHRKILEELFASYRSFCVQVTGTNAFDNAQVSAGGVDRREVTYRMESKLIPGLFFAGEVLDIDGRCGGYNLQWAWTSGYIAGKCASEDRK